MPYMEDRDNAVANLPISAMSLPEPPPFTSMQYSPEINAFARAGFATYTSPEVQYWGVTRPSSKSYIGGDLNLSSSKGQLDNQNSSFRFLTANGEFATKLNERMKLTLDASIQNSFNHLYVLDDSPSNAKTPENKYGGFSLGGELSHLENDVAGWNIKANARYYQAEMMAGDLSGKSDEGVYDASFAKRWAGAHPYETFSAELGGRLGDYSNPTSSGQWKTGYAGAEYQRLFNYETHLTANARVYYGADEFDSKVYFGPTVTIEQPVFEGAVLTGEVGGRPYVQTAEQLHATNRFLNPNYTFRHSYKMYGSASLKLNYSEVGSLTGGIRYEDISNRPIFERNTVAGQSGEKLFYGIRYADVTRIRLHAGATHQVVPEKFWLNAQVYAQNFEIKDGGRVPFTEKLGLTSGFGLRLFDQATIEGWADYIGKRKTADNQSLDAYVLLGAQFDLAITDNIGVYAKAVNLLDQEYQKWEGFTERPMQIYGGITLKL